MLAAQAELERVDSARHSNRNQMNHCTAPPAQLRLEGALDEILNTVRSNHSLSVNPKSLIECLERLQEKKLTFPNDDQPGHGNAIIKHLGKIYAPCLGRVSVVIDQTTGVVSGAEIQSVDAIEVAYSNEDAKLLPVKGAVPLSRSSLEDKGSAVGSIHTML
jgi:hypothetical protein